MKKIVIIGGGLAGLITGIRLSRKDINCTIVERKKYPFHRVCGEYISNETTPFLKKEELYPESLVPAQINKFQLSSVRGKSALLPLDTGGFGISRYTFDNFLYEKAKQSGVSFLLQTEAQAVNFHGDTFSIITGEKELNADLVIGALGKRSRLDIKLSREFIKKRSPFVGVKYHVRTDHPAHLIALHNFRGGYCGMSNVENGITNICYLTHRDNLKHFGNIPEMEKAILFENPHLRYIFSNSTFLLDAPEVINEVSFETKEPVWNHILMAGDAAGMITPLCGNGMAMAIHSAKILSDIIISYSTKNNFRCKAMEEEYTQVWKKVFSKRLWVGRQIQNKLFGQEWSSALAVNLALYMKPVSNFILKSTHGKAF